MKKFIEKGNQFVEIYFNIIMIGSFVRIIFNKYIK